MNHAQFNSQFAERRRTIELNSSDLREIDMETPDITRKILAIDEQQLDLLTGKRAEIF